VLVLGLLCTHIVVSCPNSGDEHLDETTEAGNSFLKRSIHAPNCLHVVPKNDMCVY